MTAAMTFARPYLTKGTAWRALLGGTIWGLSMAAGFAAFEAWTCGGVCLGEVIHTTALCLGTGLITVGPICAVLRRE